LGSGDEKKKRVAVKKEKAEEQKDEDKKKSGDGQAEESIKDVEEFLESPNTPQGDMGRHLINSEDGKFQRVPKICCWHCMFSVR
jgi:hypothetical protein